MSPEAFSAILESLRGKGSLTLHLPGVDPDEGLEIDPERVQLACEHDAFRSLRETEDAAYLWVLSAGSGNVRLGPIRFSFSGGLTLFDVRQITAITYESE